MKKLMNKKGFTLVELLAVIVILAVIILVAMNAVIPQMSKARKGAFLTEIETFVKGAEAYYQAESVKGNTMSECSSTGGITTCCIDIDDLKGNYIKKSDEKYKGSIKIQINADNTAEYSAYMSNGTYRYAGSTADLTEDNIMADTTDAASDCADTTTVNGGQS